MSSFGNYRAAFSLSGCNIYLQRSANRASWSLRYVGYNVVHGEFVIKAVLAVWVVASVVLLVILFALAVWEFPGPISKAILRRTPSLPQWLWPLPCLHPNGTNLLPERSESEAIYVFGDLPRLSNTVVESACLFPTQLQRRPQAAKRDENCHLHYAYCLLLTLCAEFGFLECWTQHWH